LLDREAHHHQPRLLPEADHHDSMLAETPSHLSDRPSIAEYDQMRL
jgi:hypothetical protein